MSLVMSDFNYIEIIPFVDNDLFSSEKFISSKTFEVNKI